MPQRDIIRAHCTVHEMKSASTRRSATCWLVGQYLRWSKAGYGDRCDNVTKIVLYHYTVCPSADSGLWCRQSCGAHVSDRWLLICKLSFSVFSTSLATRINKAELCWSGCSWFLSLHACNLKLYLTEIWGGVKRKARLLVRSSLKSISY